MIICIVGPTGVGKTKLSIELAKKYNAIVINADAMQIYKEMNIGTAKPTNEEKENVDHYLFDYVNVNDYYSVFNYQKDARDLLEKYHDRNIIFVGGTGLYLKAALYDYKFAIDDINSNDYDALSNEELYQLALKKDKNMNIHMNNRQRLIRFLNKKDINNEIAKELYSAIYIGLDTEREVLYKRIDVRVDQMINNGLIEEVSNLYHKYGEQRSLNTAIGYKEILSYLKKEISLEEAISLIKKNSRHYAKRQYTFFKHQLPVIWFNVDYNDFNTTIKEVEDYLNSK